MSISNNRRFSITRWHILTATIVMNFTISAATSFSVFSHDMTIQNDWSISQFTLCYAIYQACIALFGIFAGGFTDRFGPRKISLIGTFLYSTGWFFAGSCTTITQFYFCSILAGCGTGCIYNISVTSTLRWFPEMKGRISGFMLASYAIGPSVFAPFASSLLQSFGLLTAYRTMGITMFLLLIIPTFILRAAPKEGLSNIQPKIKHAPISDCSWRELLKMSIFYKLLFVFFSASIAGNMMIGTTGLVASSEIGFSQTFAAISISIGACFHFIGCLFFGNRFDKYGDFQCLVLSLSINTSALFILCMSTSKPIFLFCIAAIGFAFGGIMSLLPPIITHLFGTAHLGSNFGLLFLAFVMSAYVGPKIGAFYLDTEGLFQQAYIIAAGLSIAGLSMVFLIHYQADKAQRATLFSQHKLY